MNGEAQFLRVRQVVELVGLSKGKVFALLRDGRLRARKLDGCLLIEAASVRELLESAEPWAPRSK